MQYLSPSTALFPVILLLLLGCSSGQKQHRQIKNDSISDNHTTSQKRASDSIYVLFPKKGDSLKKGETYTLRWRGSSDSSISIFLVDSSLQAVGASVSLSDRIYAVPDKGSFDYTFPDHIKKGTYKFKIGHLESSYFQVIEKK